MQNSEKTSLALRILCIGLLVALGYHGYVHAVLHLGYPFDTFLYRPAIKFSDYTDLYPSIKSGDPLGIRLAVYFPFTYLILYPLSWLPPMIGIILMVLSFSAVAFSFIWHQLSRLGKRQQIVATMVLAFSTYPFLFAINRANIELIIMLFVFGFFACMNRGRYVAAAVLLACATAIKLYPGLYGVLLLKRRRYFASAATAIITAIITIVPASVMPGGLRGSAAQLGRNLQWATDYFVYTGSGIPFSASYFSVIKILGGLAHRAVGGFSLERWAHLLVLPYTLFSLAVATLIVAYILVVENTLWKQAALVAFTLILLPEISFDYKLIHILVPLTLFLAAPAGNAKDDRAYTIMFCLLLIPKAYIPFELEITIGVILNPLIMTIMAARIIWNGLRARGSAQVMAEQRA